MSTSVTIDLHVVVEYGLNLAEVASTVRNRVAYEVGRLTGLPVRAVEVASSNCPRLLWAMTDATD